MNQATAEDATEIARNYYNSNDADNFYWHVWGGEDIHVGWYEGDLEIAAASARTVDRMLDHLNRHLQGRGDQVEHLVDLGSGYGGAARALARRFPRAVVMGLNISETENARHRQLNRDGGLDERIQVVDGSFEAIPLADASVDVVWSQDAILHSAARERVIAEVARVLRPGGIFVFTDPMQVDDCPAGVLQPVLDRLHLKSLASPGFYRATAERCGLQERLFEAAPHQLVTHYTRVRAEMRRRAPELDGLVSDAYLQRMDAGLRHWIAGGERGHLTWGIMLFEKAG